MTLGPAADPQPGLRTLGRLLVAGAVSGAVIGATVGALLLLAPDDRSAFWVGGLLIGACLGMVAGLSLQSITCAAVLLTSRHGGSAAAVRVVGSAVPAVAVAGLAWTVAVGSALPARAGITALALLEAAVLLNATLAWSLAPLVPGARTVPIGTAASGRTRPWLHPRHPRPHPRGRRPRHHPRRRGRTADRHPSGPRSCARQRPARRRRAVRRHDHLRRP
ncbi:hypothetical protein KZX45_07285 [Georgenia sp. EYE_87]|uniref:hypothetical protein n=1 Tax=Georgenia sp. EYE_87 TaxID=2853448 RepID=UPI0020031035|nr:hypothetical protein [Georgenia sp. EYE_87]MCK6210345.1 hypothetical protein [Georgenia sp. EYE_87]